MTRVFAVESASLTIDGSNNGPHGRAEAIFPEQFQRELSEGAKSEELASDFTIFTEFYFPLLVGQQWWNLHSLGGHACNSRKNAPQLDVRETPKAPFGALWHSESPPTVNWGYRPNIQELVHWNCQHPSNGEGRAGAEDQHLPRPAKRLLNWRIMAYPDRLKSGLNSAK